MRPGLTELEAVLAVARQGSFRAAAASLEMSTSALSQSVASLESRLGTRLFHRTTRSVRLTEAGSGSWPRWVRPSPISVARSNESATTVTPRPAACASIHRSARRAASWVRT